VMYTDDIWIARPSFDEQFWDGAYGLIELVAVARVFGGCKGG